MSDDRARHLAELSSSASQIDDLSGRMVALADQYVGGEREDIAMQLFEIERALRSANRRLRGVSKSL